MSSPVDAATRSVPMRTLLAIVIGLYGAFLITFRPVDPFEWDEVLFMRAAERFDVANYAPHAPGYPVYVAAVRVVHVVVSDPQLANQVTVIIAALGLLAGLVALVRRLGGRSLEATAAVVVLGVTPAFAFNANVGLSDVPGAALAVLASLALARTWDEPRWAWLAAVLTALAAGVRPQVLAALLPLGAAVLIRLALLRRWAALTSALASGALVTAVCWIPAVLITGRTEYFKAVEILRTYVRVEELGYRLPQAPLDEAAAFWLGRPFGSPESAVAIWLLALSGAWRWWRSGCRRLVLIAAGAAVSYLVVGPFVMNFTTAVRYVIPALPFVAVLVAGNLRSPTTLPRGVVAGLVGLWCIAQLVWGFRVYELRRAPAPVWGSLEWVTQRYDPARTTVVYHGLFAPHAEWVLGRAGFEIKVARPGVIYDSSLRPGGNVVIVYSRPVPATTVVHRLRWQSERLAWLTRNRYYDCAVAEAASSGGTAYSTDFQIRDGDWELWDRGTVRLGPENDPVALVFAPLDGPLYVAGTEQRGRRIDGGEAAEIVLLPGQAGEVIVRTPRRRHVHFAPVETRRLVDAPSALSSAFVLPGVAGRRGPGSLETSWRSDVFLYNPQPASLPMVATFLADVPAAAGTEVVEFDLSPGATHLEDVLAVAGWGVQPAFGALVVRVAEAAGGETDRLFFAAARTSDALAGGAGVPSARWVRGIPFERGIAAGQSGRLRELINGGEWSEATGAVSVCRDPVVVHVQFEARDGRRVGQQDLVVPPFSQRLVAAPGEGTEIDAVVTVDEGASPGCLVFPFAVMAHASSGSVTVLAADPVRR